ncbi:DUF1513 domain-containing protein [Ancylobacter radicis]|uniref:DUF1513 domain-containing protein n=1 Tax=Ancylobacter radicis TaxID=2836179 RepID=A0ABS5R861_9HYPH|nr:DUF1513 domain-containing protein [Ancylobacter radicis]MBS9477855.1 DUF1513 domain-containing protein [Ancylobacter radicis]
MGLFELSRRSVLGALAAAPRVLFGGAAHAQDHQLDAEWVGTAGIGEGFAPVVLSPDLNATPVGLGGQRLHWVEPCPDGRTAIAVARRPGTTAILFDRRAGTVLATFEPGEGRVFSGHGRFIDGGDRFLAVEIERASGQGVVTRRIVGAAFAIEAEWTSSGIGPHDLLPAGGALIVANGGVEPHTPEAVGAEIAGASVARLDPLNGATRAVAALEEDLASLSLRHLARAPDGFTVVAAQDLLADGLARPLLYAVADARLTAFDAPDAEWRGLRTYVGSVAFDASGAYVAAASPRGNRVAVWRRDGRFIGGLTLVDGCGLAPTREAGQFLATSGLGEIALLATDGESVGVVSRVKKNLRFDNHAALVA